MLNHEATTGSASSALLYNTVVALTRLVETESEAEGIWRELGVEISTLPYAHFNTVSPDVFYPKGRLERIPGDGGIGG
jgi:hypothetical protein